MASHVAGKRFDIKPGPSGLMFESRVTAVHAAAANTDVTQQQLPIRLWRMICEPTE